jgi:hypothetical protein
MLLRLLLVVFLCTTFAACTKPSRNFLVNTKTSSPILEVKTPRSSAECSTRELHFTITQDNKIDVETCDKGRCVKIDPYSLSFMDRSVSVSLDNIRLGSGDTTNGPVIPVEGPDDLLWICREDEEAQQCVCLPWFQD